MVCVDDPVEPAEPKRKRVEKRKIGPPQNKCAMNDKYVSSPFVPAELNGQPKWMVYYHNGS